MALKAYRDISPLAEARGIAGVFDDTGSGAVSFLLKTPESIHRFAI